MPEPEMWSIPPGHLGVLRADGDAGRVRGHEEHGDVRGTGRRVGVVDEDDEQARPRTRW